MRAHRVRSLYQERRGRCRRFGDLMVRAGLSSPSTKKRMNFTAIQVPMAPPNTLASTADEDRFSVYSNDISLYSLSLQQASTL